MLKKLTKFFKQNLFCEHTLKVESNKFYQIVNNEGTHHIGHVRIWLLRCNKCGWGTAHTTDRVTYDKPLKIDQQYDND